jgi:hypothetical protein
MSKDSIDSDTAKTLADDWFRNYTYNLIKWQIDRASFDPSSQTFIFEGLGLGYNTQPDEWQHFRVDLPFERDCDGEWVVDEDRIYEESYADSDLVESPKPNP